MVQRIEQGRDNVMRVKGIVAEDFINYKLPSMFIITCQCDFKCYRELGLPESDCPNAFLLNTPDICMSIEDIYKMYESNDISKAIVIGGLEPFMQFAELEDLIWYFRSHNENCDIVIYTGYNKDEIAPEISVLRRDFKNIIIKFGRYIPNSSPRYDDILGVTLASDNQYAEKIS